LFLIALLISETKRKEGKSKAITVTGLRGPQGCEMSRLLHFVDNWLVDCGEVVSLMHWKPFNPMEDSCYSFLLQAVNTSGKVWLEASGQLKNPMTSSGIEPATVRLVA
jgi:hypothetical protein